MRTYVVEFDDYCDATVNTLSILQSIKAQEPEFVATLFAIPKRCSPQTIARAKALPWLHLAPHGWRHTRGECLGWSHDEARAKILAARDMGIDAPCFKAPAWLIDQEVYDVCEELGYVVCDHADYYIRDHSCRVYRYNDPANRARKTTVTHGHLTPVAGNWIKDMAEDGRLSFAHGSKFLTPWEAAK